MGEPWNDRSSPWGSAVAIVAKSDGHNTTLQPNTNSRTNTITVHDWGELRHYAAGACETYHKKPSNDNKLRVIV